MRVVGSVALLIAAVALVGDGAASSRPQSFLAAALLALVACFVIVRHLRFARHRRNDTVPTGNGRVRLSLDDDAMARVPRRVQLDDTLVPSVAIDDYDNLTTGEVLTWLETLSVEELRSVVARETLRRNRPAITSRARQLIELTTGTPEPVITVDRPGRLPAPEPGEGRSARIVAANRMAKSTRPRSTHPVQPTRPASPKPTDHADIRPGTPATTNDAPARANREPETQRHSGNSGLSF